MPREKHKHLDVNQEATEAEGVEREVVVVEGDGEIDIAKTEHHPGDPSEGDDVAERVR